MDIIDEAKDLFQDLVGQNEPSDQIIAALIVGGIIIATSAVGLVGTVLLLPIPLLALTLGIARLWSPVEDRWPL